MKRRSLPIVIFLVLVVFCSSRGYDQTGKFSIGGQVGFSVGFGSAFSEQKISYSYWGDHTDKAYVKNELRQEWGAKVKYGLKPNWALAGSYEYQLAKPSVMLVWTGTQGVISRYTSLNPLCQGDFYFSLLFKIVGVIHVQHPTH